MIVPAVVIPQDYAPTATRPSAAGMEHRTFEAADVAELAGKAGALVSEAADAGAAAVVFMLPSYTTTTDYLARKMVGRMTEAGERDRACHDCGAEEGTLHAATCELERCPTCGGQALFCGHCYGARGLPLKRFRAARVPHIDIPLCCCPRCLRPEPALFMVPGGMWREAVPKYLREEYLCRDCYELIAGWTAAAGEQEAAS